MAKENSSSSNPAEKAAEALGGMVMGEEPPFPTDNDATDQTNEIADIFGLGEEAGPAPNSSESGSDGGASPSDATPAAESGKGQAQPATPSTTQPSSGQQGEPPQAPAQPEQAPAAPAAVPEAGQAQTPSDEGPSVQALRAQVDALIAQNAQLLERMNSQGAGTQVPQQQGPSGQQGQQQEADPYMDYRFAIPDDVAGAIFNEDPSIARQGLTHLVNSLGRIIHERAVKSVTERILPQALNEFQGGLQLTTQQERMRTEYFSAFPQHNDPGTRLIVAQEANTMWTQNPSLTWDKHAMNALGARVNQRLGIQAQPQQQQQPQQANGSAQGQPAPRPAAQMGASNRPPVADNNEDFISDVLSAG